MENQILDYLEIKSSSIEGTGAFANQDIVKGTTIAEYIGERITKEQAKERLEAGNAYVFDLNDNFDIDGLADENEAKWINHSCNPNCEIEIEKEERIWIVAIKDIKKGEELTYNYQYTFDDFKDNPCKCGSENCVGFMLEEESWPRLKAYLADKQ